jgi:hypothetical protein
MRKIARRKYRPRSETPNDPRWRAAVDPPPVPELDLPDRESGEHDKPGVAKAPVARIALRRVGR